MNVQTAIFIYCKRAMGGTAILSRTRCDSATNHIVSCTRCRSISASRKVGKPSSNHYWKLAASDEQVNNNARCLLDTSVWPTRNSAARCVKSCHEGILLRNSVSGPFFLIVDTIDGLIDPPQFPCSRGQVVGTNFHLPRCVPELSGNPSKGCEVKTLTTESLPETRRNLERGPSPHRYACQLPCSRCAIAAKLEHAAASSMAPLPVCSW